MPRLAWLYPLRISPHAGAAGEKERFQIPSLLHYSITITITFINKKKYTQPYFVSIRERDASFIGPRYGLKYVSQSTKDVRSWL